MSEENHENKAETNDSNIVEIEIKVKKHPKSVNYPNTRCREHGIELGKFISKLSVEQMEQYREDELFLDKTKTLEIFNQILVDDLVGVFYFYGLVKEKTEDSLTIVYDIKKNLTTTFSLSKLDSYREMGYFDILYRLDKEIVEKNKEKKNKKDMEDPYYPYGIDRKKKIKVQINDYTKNENSQINNEKK